jgi:phosphate starvation-inducible membrane PsiE
MYSVGTFGFFIQNITFVVTAPWWAFIHILTSPAAAPFPGSFSSNVLAISKLDLAILPVSIILGYLVPSILMTLPSPAVVSAIQHQQAIALWQPFPIWCVIFQISLRYVGSIFVGSKESATKTPHISLAASYVSSAAHVYRFIIGLCMITHLPALAIALLPYSNFSNSHPIVQNLAKAEFAATYIPYLPVLTTQVESFAAGVHAFLQWDMYIGATAMLVWGIYLHQNAAKEKSVAKLLGKVGVWTLLAGPSGALAVLMWERDEMAQGKVKQGI